MAYAEYDSSFPRETGADWQTPERRFFSPDGSYEPGFEYAGDSPGVSGERWPDQIFVFGKNGLLGNELLYLPADPKSRLRSMAGALSDGSDNLNHLTLKKSLGDINTYLNSPSPLKVGEKSLSFRAAMHPIIPLSIIESFWEIENHPVWQALCQVREQYYAQLGPIAMAQLAEDTILSTQPALIRRMYESHFRDLANPDI
jgi:hypothetical protein